MKNQTNELMSWQAFRKGIMEKIEDVKEEIKLKTDGERATLKKYRSDLKTANWKIEQLFESINEEVEANNSITTTLTLDDFDVEGKSLDVELANGEMKEAQKEESE